MRVCRRGCRRGRVHFLFMYYQCSFSTRLVLNDTPRCENGQRGDGATHPRARQRQQRPVFATSRLISRRLQRRRCVPPCTTRRVPRSSQPTGATPDITSDVPPTICTVPASAASADDTHSYGTNTATPCQDTATQTRLVPMTASATNAMDTHCFHISSDGSSHP